MGKANNCVKYIDYLAIKMHISISFVKNLHINLIGHTTNEYTLHSCGRTFAKTMESAFTYSDFH